MKALNSSSEDQSEVSLPEKPMMHEQLWVDKYAPNSFTELLSDEQTNREVYCKNSSRFLQNRKRLIIV